MTATAPTPRATCSPASARRSAVMAAVTTASARKSMIPMTSRIVVHPAQQPVQWRPGRKPCRQSVAASATKLRLSIGADRKQAS